MRQPIKRDWGVVEPGFLVIIWMFALLFSPSELVGQQAILVNPDFYSNEITIRDTLIPAEGRGNSFDNRLAAVASLNDPVLLDSLPEIQTYLYRTGLQNKFPVLLVRLNDHWRLIEMREFEGYGIPKIYRVKQKHSALVLIEATLRERYFTSDEYPSGYQAEKSLILLFDATTGQIHLQQVGNLKIEQGRWSKGAEGNVASSFEQSLEISFRKQIMNMMIKLQKKKYATSTGTEVKSQRISLEYKFQKGIWIRSKAAMMSY